jgi:hypothetical protein
LKTVLFRLLAVIPVALGLGCTKAIPSFDDIMSVGLPGPTLSGSTFRSEKIITTNSLVSINGECPTDIQALEWSLDNGSSWSTPAYIMSVVDPVDLDCTDAIFSINIFNPGAILPLTNDGDRARIRIRGLLASGEPTNYAELEVDYDYPNAASLVFTAGPPAQVMAGESLAMTIELRDSANNVVITGPEANMTVNLSVHSGSGSLIGTVARSAVNGIVVFNDGDPVSITVADDYVLRAQTAGGLATDTTAFEIVPAAANSLVWTGTPSSPIAGEPMTPTIEVHDVFGNIVDSGPDSAASISLGINSGVGGATLNGTTAINAVNGVAAWTAAQALTLDLAGTYSLKAVYGALAANSSTFTVVHNVPAVMAWTTQPATNTAAGDDLLPVIEIRDAYGNIVTSGADGGAPVTLSVFSGPGSINGTVTKSAVNGVVSFQGTDNLNLQVAGSYVLEATKADTLGIGGTGSLGSTSGGFNIIPAAAAKLAWSSQPVNNTPVTAPLAFSVQVRDAYDNIVTSSVATVSIALQSGSGSITGTLSLSASFGVASWTATQNVALSASGSKTLRAASAGLTSAVSSPFNIKGFPVTLSGTPSNPSNTSTLNVSVNGAGVTHYIYKVGPAGSTDCSIPSGYGPVTPVMSNITDSVSPHGETNLRLCVRGGDGTYFEPAVSAASHSWTRDVTAPPAPTGLTLEDPAISPYPDSTPTIRVAGPGWSNVTLKVFSDWSCTAEVGTLFLASGTDADVTTSSLPQGSYSFYAAAVDSAGNQSGCAGSVSYEYDPTAPFTVDVQPVYPSYSNWNDYVEFDNDGGGTNRYNQDQEECAGSSTLYSSCIHGGEARKVIVTGYAFCEDLSAEDQLGVFDWECLPEAGTATFYSRGLKPGKGLRDLINFPPATGFFLNSVTIRNFGTTIAQSNPSTWWWNTIYSLTDNSGYTSYTNFTSLTSPGSIYVLPNNQITVGYHISADKIAVVTAPGVTLSFKDNLALAESNCGLTTGTFDSADTRAIFCSSARKFIWMEVDLDGSATGGANPAQNGIVVSGTSPSTDFGWRQSRILNSKIIELDQSIGHDGVGLFMKYSNNNSIVDFVVHKAPAGGVYMNYSQNNQFTGLKVAGAAGAQTAARAALLMLDVSSNNNRFYNTRLGFHSASGSYGLNIYSAANNIFSGLNIYNIGSASNGRGISVFNSSGTVITQSVVSAVRTGAELKADQGSIISHSTYANNSLAGVYFSNSSLGWITTLNSMAIGNSSVGIDSDSSHNAGINVYGSVASRTPSAAISYSGTGGITLYDHFGHMLAETVSASGSPSYRENDITGAFVGPIGTNDSENSTNDASGAISFAGLLDMLNFANSYRNWGRNASFPGTGAWYPCTSGYTCAIWDWRVRASGSLFNVSFDGSTPNISFSAGSSCPAFVSGDATITAASKTFLKHALEINLDGIGNDNGLCESSESCIYTPNIGAYQGEGDYSVAGTCSFTDGAVSGVRLYAYPTNGQ